MSGQVPYGDSVSFGPFRLFPAARAFEKDGMPIVLGNRALDILMVLVEHAGEVVSHRELTSRVWRGLVVDPTNLRVHITALRRALGEGDGKTRYISNVTGQGYCFVAPLTRSEVSPPPARVAEYPCGAARQRLVLPPLLTRMIGREQAVSTIAADLIADRFVTLIGPGGIGKTTVAVSVAHAMLEEFGDAVCFVELSNITDPKRVATTIAASLGLSVQTDDVLPALMQCLGSLRVLLVLDNCEHVVEAAATLAERIFQEAPAVHILATSREALRVEGEHAFWIAPLASPEPGADVNVAEALTYPAVKLFLERAAAGGRSPTLTDVDAAHVATICNSLDGIPLAIEFAAARVASHGLAEIAERLKTRLGLQWKGRRTALPRHQTLHAMLDWSHGLLPEPEQRVLRRLSVFVGPFDLEAAQAVACDAAMDAVRVAGAVEGLVGKSLVSVSTGSASTRYRLLETTRVYALEKLEESGEKGSVAHVHARYFAALLDRLAAGAGESAPERVSVLSRHLGNLRAALEWAFSEGVTREPALTIHLAASSAPVLLELSLLPECSEWSAAALALLDESTRGGAKEMVLQEALAISTAWSVGNHGGVRAALERAIEIAAKLGDTSRRLRLLAGLHVFLVRVTELRESLVVAESFASALPPEPDVSLRVIADSLLGASHHFLGNQPTALRHLERALSLPRSPQRQLFGLDYRMRGLICCARAQWLSGFPERGLATTHEMLAVAATSNRPLDVCFSYVYSAPVFLWCNDLVAAREVLEKLKAHPNWPALPSLHATALAMQGELLLREGQTARGVELLRSAVAAMRADRQNLHLARASGALAEGLAVLGQWSDAHAVVSIALAEAGDSGELCHYPELLRIQARIVASMPDPDAARAEQLLLQAVESARRQGAVVWEQRAAEALARIGADAPAPLQGAFTDRERNTTR